MESTRPRTEGWTRSALLEMGRESASRGRRLASLVAASGRDPAGMVFDLRSVPQGHRLSQFVNALLGSYEVVGAYPAARFLEATWLTSKPFEEELVQRQIALSIRFHAEGTPRGGSASEDPEPGRPARGWDPGAPAPAHAVGDAEPWPPPEWFV